MRYKNKLLLVVLAGGSGTRLGCEIPKAFVTLDNQTILYRSLSVFFECKPNFQAVVPVPKDYLQKCQDDDFAELGTKREQVTFIPGGVTRAESVRCALKYLINKYDLSDSKSQADYYIIVHDAARCLLQLAELNRLIEAMFRWQAASLGVPSKDSIKRVDKNGRVLESLKRTELWQVQTPQAFRLDLLVEAHKHYIEQQSELEVTDDASLVEQIHPVQMVTGSYSNFKITSATDLELAKFLIERKL